MQNTKEHNIVENRNPKTAVGDCTNTNTNTNKNLKTAEDCAAVCDCANGAGKSQKTNGGKDVAVDELPAVGDDDDDDDDINDMNKNVEHEWQMRGVTNLIYYLGRIVVSVSGV